MTDSELSHVPITDEHMAELACKIKVGDRVVVTTSEDHEGRKAEVMFVGKIPELANGYWVRGL